MPSEPARSRPNAGAHAAPSVMTDDPAARTDEGTTHQSVERLWGTVVSGGYCVGCGVCTGGEADAPLAIQMDPAGMYQAVRNSGARAGAGPVLTEDVCPFSESSVSEDRLASELFGNCQEHPLIGRYSSCYAGFVGDAGVRAQGSSGGLGTWLVLELFRKRLIDGAIHVRPLENGGDQPRLFAYALSSTEAQIRAGAKSRYYPVELSHILAVIRQRPGRYAVVGVPCFVKGLRLLCRQDPIIRERLVFFVGLFCGHLKSTAFAAFQAWQCGVRPDGLRMIDFRKKLPGRPADRYGVEVVGQISDHWETRVAAVADLYGSDWGLGFFKYKACDYCDDVTAETADVAVGDAWLSQYTPDGGGTNVVVARSALAQEILDDGRAKGLIVMHQVPADTVARSQDAGLRHRRFGLAYRLYRDEAAHRWHPPKRVAASASHLNAHTRRIQDLRVAIARESHIAWQAALRRDLRAFFLLMDGLVAAYALCQQAARRKRGPGRIQSIVLRVGRRIQREIERHWR